MIVSICSIGESAHSPTDVCIPAHTIFCANTHTQYLRIQSSNLQMEFSADQVECGWISMLGKQLCWVFFVCFPFWFGAVFVRFCIASCFVAFGNYFSLYFFSFLFLKFRCWNVGQVSHVCVCVWIWVWVNKIIIYVSNKWSRCVYFLFFFFEKEEGTKNPSAQKWMYSLTQRHSNIFRSTPYICSTFLFRFLYLLFACWQIQESWN